MGEAQNRLGRVLFVKRSRISSIVIFAAASIAIMFAGYAFPQDGNRRVLSYIVGSILAATALEKTTAFFRCHQHGIVRRAFLLTKVLLFEDVGSFSYTATRRTNAGIHIESVQEALFVPRNPGLGKPLYYVLRRQDRASATEWDRDLERLRDRVSGVLADRMEEDFRASRPVPWIPSLRFVPKGLEYTPQGAASSEPILLPFDAIDHVATEGDHLRLWMRDNPAPVLEESTAAPNFYPGRLLLGRILKPLKSAPA